MTYQKSVVGDLINFRGMVYAPINENGVVFLFGKVMEDLHMYVEEIKPGFPDCIARRFTGKGWERIRIEFEFRSSNFKLHKHDPKDCDIVVCWEHDWKDCPLEVIELHTEIQDMKDFPIKKPGKSRDDEDFEKTLDALFDRRKTQPGPRTWWEPIYEGLLAFNEEIWLNIGKKWVGVYSPEKSFATWTGQKTMLGVRCFTRGEPMQGVKIVSKQLAPRWGRFSVKSEADVDFAVKTLTEACERLKAAIKAGEPTGYFSGGKGSRRKAADGDDDDADDEA